MSSAYEDTKELNRFELRELIKDAPEWSSGSIKEYAKESNIDPYDYFKENAIDQIGFLVNKRPLYFGALIKRDGKNVLWTIINSDIKHHLFIYKTAKRMVHDWQKLYGTLYSAINLKHKPQIMWTMRMGFKPISKNNEALILKLGG